MIKPHCLKDRHTLSEFPAYPCPRCEATLLPVDKKLDYQQSAESAICEKIIGPDADYFCGVFSLLLRCSMPKCAEVVFCSGSFTFMDEGDAQDGPSYVPALRPEFFTPSIRIFSPPKDLPEKVSKPLLDAFSLFWNNPSASGNSLRISIEGLLDYRCVKKWTLNSKGKEEALSLHARILEFKKQKPELAEKLLAIKWIGNGGSHLSGLELKDMVVAFRLMEHVLDELFNKTTEELAGIAKKINKNKSA